MQLKMPVLRNQWREHAPLESASHLHMEHSEERGEDTVETCKMTAACGVIAVVLVLAALVAVGYVMPLIL